jgi:pSer/pThr/pTyr-binding forkhead associated (FHA) protein
LSLYAEQNSQTGDQKSIQNLKNLDIQSILSRKNEFLVGRSADCDLVLEDTLVSRRHARLFKKEGKVWIEDLNSSNGVFLNGKKISY